MVAQENEGTEFEDISVATLERYEVHKFSARFGYSREDLAAYRASHSLEERWALSIDPRKETPRVREIIDTIIHYSHESLMQDRAYQEHHKQFITNVNKKLQKLEIESALRGERAGYEDLTTICITSGALETAYVYARRMIEATGTTNEVYFHLVGNGQDTVARGISIPMQEASGTHCVPTDSPNLAVEEHLVGWSHSHGSLNVFHSLTDYNRLKTIPYLNGVRRTIEAQGLLITPREVEAWVCPSIVVNARNECALAVSAEYLDPMSEKLQIHIAEAPLMGSMTGRYRVLEEQVKQLFIDTVRLEVLPDLSVVPSEAEIDRTIWERVRPRGGFTKAFESQMRQIRAEPSILEEIIETQKNEEDDAVHVLTEKEYATILRKLETLQRNYATLLDKYTALRPSGRFWRK